MKPRSLESVSVDGNTSVDIKIGRHCLLLSSCLLCCSRRLVLFIAVLFSCSHTLPTPLPIFFHNVHLLCGLPGHVCLLLYLVLSSSSPIALFFRTNIQISWRIFMYVWIHLQVSDSCFGVPRIFCCGGRLVMCHAVLVCTARVAPLSLSMLLCSVCSQTFFKLFNPTAKLRSVSLISVLPVFLVELTCLATRIPCTFSTQKVLYSLQFMLLFFFCNGYLTKLFHRKTPTFTFHVVVLAFFLSALKALFRLSLSCDPIGLPLALTNRRTVFLSHQG